MLLAITNGGLRRAEPRLSGVCPGCQQVVQPKCGDILIWHWAHLPNALASCDDWTEPETEWHLAWKNRALEAGCQIEVTMRDKDEWHRADIVRPDGVVIEVQHSSLGIGEAGEREAFYRAHGGLIWIWDARERYWDRLSYDGYHQRLVWEQPSQTIESLRAPMYWDTTEGLKRVTNEGSGWQEMYLSARFADESEVFEPTESDVLPTALAAAAMPPSKAWTVLPERCASCGGKPNGTFNDGSPRYRCHILDPEGHRPIVAA